VAAAGGGVVACGVAACGIGAYDGTQAHDDTRTHDDTRAHIRALPGGGVAGSYTAFQNRLRC